MPTSTEIADRVIHKMAEGPAMDQQPQPSKLPDWLTPDNVAKGTVVSAAGASPFLGLIGQKPVIHDPLGSPNVPTTHDIQELRRAAQPGDVLVSTRGAFSPYKAPQAYFSGTDYYHAEPVVMKEDGIAKSMTSGSMYNNPVVEGKEPLEALKQSVPVADVLKEHVPSSILAGDSVTLMRPKVPLTPEQQKVFLEDFAKRTTTPYSSETAIGSWLKDIFVPKNLKVEHNPAKECAGDICSTAVSKAYETATGKAPLDFKPTSTTMPADLLREGSAFEPVMHHLNAANKPFIKNRMAAQVGARAALGLGTAGLAYGAYENPEVAGGIAGAAGATNATRKILELAAREGASRPEAYLKAKEQLPQLWSLLDEGMGVGGQIRPAAGKFLSRTLPLAAAGGAVGYLGTKKIHDMINNYRKNSSLGEERAIPRA